MYTQRRLGSVWHPPCLISLRYPPEKGLDPQLFIQRTEKTDQTGRMPRQILSLHCAYKSFCWSCRGSIFWWNRLLINLLHSKGTHYSVLENVLWRICLIEGRLKDCSLMACFDNIWFTCITMLWIVSKHLFSYQYFADYLPCVLDCAAETLVIDWDTFFRAKIILIGEFIGQLVKKKKNGM